MGRTGGDLRIWRALGPRGDGPQRTPADALSGDPRRLADRRLGSRNGVGRRGRHRREGPHRPRSDDRRTACQREAVPRPRAERRGRRAASVRRLAEACDALRRHPAPRAPRIGVAQGRSVAALAGVGRLDDGGYGADPASHGRGRQGGDRVHGRRLAARGAVRAVSRAAPFLPPELQSGYQPADRQPAREARDEPDHAAGQSREYPRRGRKPARVPATRLAGAAEQGVRRAVRLSRRERRRDRLHLPARGRRARAGRRALPHPVGGRGRGSRRRQSSYPQRPQRDARTAADPDDSRHRRGAHPSRAKPAAVVHLDQCPHRGMLRRALLCRAHRRRRDDGERLAGAGGARRPAPPRPVRRSVAGRGAAALQDRGRRRPAQDHVQDGHRHHQQLPGRL